MTAAQCTAKSLERATSSSLSLVQTEKRVHRTVWAVPEERPLMTGRVRWVVRQGLHVDKYFHT